MQNPVSDPYCIHGHWEDGICICDNGYETVFVDLTLNPLYCSSDEVIVEKDPFYSNENLFHVMAMALTVIITTCSWIALSSLIVALLTVFQTRHRILSSKHKLLSFEAHQIRRDTSLAAEIWDPPQKFFQPANHTVTQENKGQFSYFYGGHLHCPNYVIDFGNKGTCMLQAKVLHQYKPQDKEELELHPEDIITEVVELQDGWCRGKINGKVGFFPAAFVEIIVQSET